METERDLFSVPVSALQRRIRGELSCKLNERKVLLSPDKKYQRDYRGLADCMGLKVMWAPGDDRMKKLLDLWLEKNSVEANLGKLCEFLERIDRFDVLDDLRDWFIDDARQYFSRNSQLTTWQPSNIETEIPDDDFFFTGDQEIYDAFLLYVDADYHFARFILGNMEAAHLRICDKNRNLRPGEIEFSAINKLIEHRCRTLIAIFSDEFLQDKSYKNAFDFAWSLSLKSKVFRGVIPCVYKYCVLPGNYLTLVRLDYNRYDDEREFLNKLHSSITWKTGANCTDPRLSPNPIPFQNDKIEAPRKVSPKDSEPDEVNREPPVGRPLSKRFRFIISLLSPKKKRKHGEPVVSEN